MIEAIADDRLCDVFILIWGHLINRIGIVIEISFATDICIQNQNSVCTRQK